MPHLTDIGSTTAILIIMGAILAFPPTPCAGGLDSRESQRSSCWVSALPWRVTGVVLAALHSEKPYWGHWKNHWSR
jgi:hypothetical protein